MKSCNCTYVGFTACYGCPNNKNNQEPLNDLVYRPLVYTQKVKRIIEKFDDKGNLIERITEE